MSMLISAMATEAVYALAAALAVFVPAAVGAIAMCFVISKAIDAIARQPEADGKIRSAMILGIVFIETTIIYALIIGIMIVIQLF